MRYFLYLYRFGSMIVIIFCIHYKTQVSNPVVDEWNSAPGLSSSNIIHVHANDIRID